jgi:large subunit ribosomal protein L4
MAKAMDKVQQEPFGDRNTTAKKSDGSDGGVVVLSGKVFGAKIVTGLMHQAVLAEAVNSRQDTRNTKTRGEVAGGGRKPYRQKGTGRARQGSISAPHYRHGGIVFGPHPRDLSAKLPKKARRVAITSALSSKAADGEVTVLESLSFDTISTKSAATLLDDLGILGKALVVLPRHDVTIYKSFRNIPGVQVRVAPAFSVRDVLDAGQVIIVQDALENLDAAWGGISASSRETTGPEVAAE